MPQRGRELKEEKETNQIKGAGERVRREAREGKTIQSVTDKEQGRQECCQHCYCNGREIHMFLYAQMIMTCATEAGRKPHSLSQFH